MSNTVFLVAPSAVALNPLGGKIGEGIPPLSLLYLGGSIKNLCEKVEYFDFNVKENTFELFEQKLNEQKPVCVGVNCLFSGIFEVVLVICEFIKKTLPHTKVVIGGMHPTIFARKIMENCECVDAIVLGEGEKAFPLLLKEYLQNSKIININNLDSALVREEEQIIELPKKSYIENLDSLKPDYESLCFKDYERNTEKWFDPNNIKINPVSMPILTSRSCPNSCNFCAMRLVMGNKIRLRSAENVFDEIKMLYEIYGVNFFKIMDDNFTFSKRRALEICNLIIKNNLKIAMHFRNGLMVKTLDKEMIDALCLAGGIMFALAIESGSDYIRNTIMHKNCSREKIFEVVQNLRKYNVYISAFFIVGLPEETAETVADTLDMIKEIDTNNIGLFKVTPFPGTALYEQCMRDKLFTKEIDEDNLWKCASGKGGSFGGTLEHFVIKPYNLSLDVLEQKYVELSNIVELKNRKWVEHMAKSTST